MSMVDKGLAATKKKGKKKNMKSHIAQALEERLAPLTKRIEKLEQCISLEGVDAIVWQSAEEDDIMRRLDALADLAQQAGSTFSRRVKKKLQGLVTRMTLLPSVPRIEVIRLAQNILAQKPVMLVTDDIFHKKRQRPELTRVVSMETTETSCFDYQFPSFSCKKEELLAMDEIVGIDGITVLPASLEKAWGELQNVLHGRFVVAFDFPLVQLQLSVTARRHGLPVPMLVGHSLLDLLLKYVRVKDSIGAGGDQNTSSFSDLQLCDALAKEDLESFTDLSVPTDQRALHLLHALQAIGSGTLSLQEPSPVEPVMSFVDPFAEPFSVDES